MVYFRLCLAIVMGFTFSVCCYAHDRGEYIFASLFYTELDDDRGDLDGGVGVNTGYGWKLRDRLYPEINLFADVLDTGNTGGSDFYQIGAGLDLRFDLTESDWRPFLIGGLGVVHDDVVPNSMDSYNGYANLGVGLLSPAMDHGIRLRADIRAYWSSFEDNQLDYRLGLGVIIPLGTVEVREIEVIREVEKVVYQPAPDNNLNNPDLDGDGVPNDIDDCPNTLPGSDVDDAGCILSQQTITLTGVNFSVNSARLQPESRVVLDRIADSLSGQPDLAVEIAGHTDSTGATEYNLNLSQARANSVRAYLMSRGIDADRMVARGYGETEPVDTNANEQGRSANRRVEFRAK